MVMLKCMEVFESMLPVFFVAKLEVAQYFPPQQILESWSLIANVCRSAQSFCDFFSPQSNC